MARYVYLLLLSSFFPLVVAADIQVVDDAGNAILLDLPAQRIVSLAPHITEMLFAVGAGKNIVATVRYSDFPEVAKSIPKIGSYKEVSFESLLNLNPDLIIAWPSGNGDEIVGRLRSLGLPVYLDEPRAIADIADSLRRFGVLTANEQTATEVADNFTQELQDIRIRYSQQETVSVFYQVWDEPLTTLNGDHLISDIIRLCGGRNVFAAAIPLAPIVNVESVLSANPQVIVVSGMGDERPDWLDYWKRWPALAAADNDQLYFIPPDFLQRSSPRIITGAKQMCEFLHQAREIYHRREQG